MDASRSLQTACRDRMGPENEVDAQLHVSRHVAPENFRLMSSPGSVDDRGLD